ncbi:MAG TPA: hypothetical protein VND90_05725 [Terracidiphilus sp.]|nr:hypothetical protein [Terracidiphilus sp.]
MDTLDHNNPYHAAFREAATELSRIHGEFEQLNLRRQQVENLVQALKPAVAPEARIQWEPVVHMSKFDGLTVVTRLAVVEKGAKP